MTIMDGSEYIAPDSSSKVRIRFLLDNASDKQLTKITQYLNNFVQDKMGSNTPMVDYVTDVDETELPKEMIKYLEEFI